MIAIPNLEASMPVPLIEWLLRTIVMSLFPTTNPSILTQSRSEVNFTSSRNIEPHSKIQSFASVVSSLFSSFGSVEE